MIAYICPECKGTALNCFICNKEEENDVDYIPIYDFEDCKTCKGLGYLEVEE